MLETGQDSSAIQKRANLYKSIAKTLLLLQQADRNALTQTKPKALENLTDAELVKLVTDAQLAVKDARDTTDDARTLGAHGADTQPRFPHGADGLIGSAKSRRKNKNSVLANAVSDNIGLPADEPGI
jgi:hypothetical protein